MVDFGLVGFCCHLVGFETKRSFGFFGKLCLLLATVFFGPN
jgi:hypothetical protein